MNFIITFSKVDKARIVYSKPTKRNTSIFKDLWTREDIWPYFNCELKRELLFYFNLKFINKVDNVERNQLWWEHDFI